MGSIADVVMSGLQGYARGEGELQQRGLAQQELAKNQRLLNRDRDKTVMGAIMGGDAEKYFKVDPKGQRIVDVDMVGFAQESPELAREFLNTVPSALLAATDEKGNQINVKIRGVRPVKVEGQEMFAVEVERPDGKVAPLTRRGTAAPDDNVILMSRDDLNGLASQRAVSMYNNGAFDNGSTFARGMADIQDAIGVDNARKEQALRDEVSEMLNVTGVPVAEGREIYDIFSRLEGDELLRAAKDFGIDVDAVFAELNESIAAEKAAQEAATKAAEAAKTPQLSEAATAATLASGTRGFERRALENMGKPKKEPETETKPERGPLGPTLSDVKRRVTGEAEVGTRGDYSYESLRKRIDGFSATSAEESSISPALKEAPQEVQEAIINSQLDPEQRKQAILDAVAAGLAKPSEAQVAYVRDHMIAKGYTSPSSLSNAPPEEVMNIAFTLAGAANVANMADRLKMADSILNFAQFGNSETSQKDIATLALKQQEEQRLADKQAGEDARRPVEDWRKAQEITQPLIKGVRDGIERDKRGYIKGPPSREALSNFQEIVTRYDQARGKDPIAERAAMEAFNEVFPDYMAAHVIGEERSSFWEWMTGPIQDFFTRAPYREVNTDYGAFRIIYDSKGAPKALELMTPKGDTAEGGRINMNQLKGFIGSGELRDNFLATIEATSELKQARN